MMTNIDDILVASKIGKNFFNVEGEGHLIICMIKRREKSHID